MNRLLEYDIDYSLSLPIDKEILNKYKILPLKNQELSILVATSNVDIPHSKMASLFQKPIHFITFDEQSINKELQYIEFKQKLYDLSENALRSTNVNKDDSYIIDFIETLFSFSIVHNASDIHFEAFDKSILIRIRIDGELNQIFRFDLKLFALISSIIKYFGNLDISQKRVPLNGRFSHKVDNITYDMRISTMPTIHGESIVLRILDNGNIKKDINNIGFDKSSLEIIKRNLLLTQGLILVTGPTGSGKTTSLYSMVNLLNTKNKKIITIEDPVEYKIDGVMQVNINDEINLNYNVVLKNVLRQDPDILLIGEVRDSESLQIAIQASLTGHLVIATLHTNSALETITRLKDLKAEPYLISSTLKMIVSQRLLRLLCPYCQNDTANTSKVDTGGCIECNYVGYKNRTIISEVLEVDKNISEMIAKNTPLYKIEEYLKEINFSELKSSAMRLVNDGKTTLDEVYSRV